MFGDPTAWYASYHGYNIGINIKVIDGTTNDDYAYCYLELKVKHGTSTLASDWAFLGGGFASVAAVGYMYRRRRVATLELDSDEGINTNFELVSDQFVSV